MEYELYELDAQDKMEQAIEGYRSNLSKISAGRANPQLLSSVKVLYYDTPTPLVEIASISVPEPRQLLIKPFDRSVNKDIVSAINKASLGVNAVDEGYKARITIPEITTQRRKELVKSLAKFTEQAKVQVRNARQEANKAIKGDDELSEDVEKSYLEEIQKLTNKFTAKVDEMTKAKEKDLMTI